MPTLNVYSAKRYVIAAKTPGGLRKLFQIVCASRDGSVFVTFPYRRWTGGRLGVVKVGASLAYPADINVGYDFPATSHSVKYAHHPSGQAHFSLTGKIRTQVKKQAVPLRSISGHLFTVIFQGVESFDSETNKIIGVK